MAEIAFDIRYHQQIPDIVLVLASGVLDGGTIVAFDNQMDELRGKGATRLLLDMEKVTRINSTGISTLVRQADAFTEAEGEMVLIKVTPAVMTVLRMLGVDDFFHAFSDPRHALKHVMQKKPQKVGSADNHAAPV
ncbi:MAG: STAS domain-containing protein [Planctomycetota bacterium]